MVINVNINVKSKANNTLRLISKVNVKKCFQYFNDEAQSQQLANFFRRNRMT